MPSRTFCIWKIFTILGFHLDVYAYFFIIRSNNYFFKKRNKNYFPLKAKNKKHNRQTQATHKPHTHINIRSIIFTRRVFEPCVLSLFQLKPFMELRVNRVFHDISIVGKIFGFLSSVELSINN